MLGGMKPTLSPHLLYARNWLFVGVAALAASGLFSIVLVVARTPGLSETPFFKLLFGQALVVHVDLSVLVWFLSITCMSWALLITRRSMIQNAALIAFALGACCIALSPLDHAAETLKSNYIPVIDSPIFFFGLALVMSGVLLALLCQLCFLSKKGDIEYGIITSTIIVAAALIAFIWSALTISPVLSGEYYYEVLFWGGGHLLIFAYTQVMLVAWLWLTRAIWPEIKWNDQWLKPLFFVGILAAATSLYPYMHYDIETVPFRNFFTQQMIWLGGLAPGVLALWIASRLWKYSACLLSRNALQSTLFMSLLLFAVGGGIGAAIEGQDVTIPAHYHGSIVAVTLAFMGVAYLYLPRFGYADVKHWRLAYWQPILYGFGQILHISGLAWSGGYGVLRKTPGALEDGFSSAKAAMGLMGFGGLLAIIGGLLFVIIIIKALCKDKCYEK